MTLDPQALPPASAPLLVAVSGGRDSMALLHALHQLGTHSLVVCHINHGLRGAESDADAALVHSYSEALSLPFELAEIDVPAHAAAHHQSIELAAREVRYAYFHRCAEKWNTQNLALAHHADDQAETVLHNLFRGSSGLRGMRPISERTGLHLHRPLLHVRRSLIDQHIQSQNIPYREDGTNAQPVATRNRFRNELFPLLTDVLQRDPIPPLLSALNDQWDMVSSLDHYLDPTGRLHLPSVRQLPAGFQDQLLHAFLRRHAIPDLSRALIHRCRALIAPDAAPKLNLPGGDFLRRQQSRLFVERQQQ